MSEKQPNLNDFPELGKERIPADDAVRKHRAGALFRVNLPPLRWSESISLRLWADGMRYWMQRKL